MTKRHYAVAVSLIRVCLLGLAVDVAVSASAAAQPAQNASAQKPPLMDRDKEVVLALSACPRELKSVISLRRA